MNIRKEGFPRLCRLASAGAACLAVLFLTSACGPDGAILSADKNDAYYTATKEFVPTQFLPPFHGEFSEYDESKVSHSGSALI